MGKKFYKFVIKLQKIFDGYITLAIPVAKRIFFPIYYNAEIELEKLKETETESNRTTLYIIIGVVGGIILISIIIVALICIRRCKNEATSNNLLT